MNTCRVISKDHDEFESAIKKFLLSVGIQIVDETTPADFSIVLGGDGTALGAARRGLLVSPVVIINTGNLGFLSSSSFGLGVETIQRLLEGDFSITSRHLLTTQIYQSEFFALNDVVVRPIKVNKLITLSLYDDSEDFLIANYRADGLIIASPTGSTAYNLSAGGPIIHPACQVFCVTPIAAQGLTQRPLVLPSSTRLRIEVDDDDLYLSVDGQDGLPVIRGDSIMVSYNSHSIQTVNPVHSYYRTLQEKLGWGIKPVKP